MKVLLVSNMWPGKEKAYSGIFVRNQFIELKKYLGPDIQVFYLERKFTSRIGSVIKYLNSFLRFIPYLFKKYDIVHLHFFYPFIYLVWLYKFFYPKSKLVVTFHGSDINYEVNESNLLLARKAAKAVDFAIPVGNELAKRVKTKLQIPIGMVLPVGVNDSVFYNMNIEKKFDFLFVGSFFKVKGIDILIKTITKLPKNTSFCLVGKGDEFEPRIRELMDQGYNIVLKLDQSQEDLRKLYNESRFLVQPSRNEGFPTVTIEAMFCGTPILTSDIPQFKEQVNQGVNGFYVSNEDTQAFVEKMIYLKKISETEYSKLQKGALQSFKELSLTEVCLKIMNTYKNLVKI